MVKVVAATVLVLLILIGGFYFVSSTNKGETELFKKINPNPKTSSIKDKTSPTINRGSNNSSVTVTGDINNTDSLDSDITRSGDDINTIDGFNNDASIDGLDTDVIALTQ